MGENLLSPVLERAPDMKNCSTVLWIVLTWLCNATFADNAGRNIVFILVDDQRYDALSCMGHPFLKTPAADSLVEGGVRFANAFVTTSLCSPSRASILTGLYAHSHRVVDNQSGMPDDLRFFSQDLQDAGYETAFIGKWHMGYASDEPRKGWNHWVSFTGQGHYFPELPGGGKAQLNVDGRRVDQTEYITDELTKYAINWLQDRGSRGKPWMLYLSHKAIHHDFSPAPRHQGTYAKAEIKPFPTSKGTEWDALKPMWARNQRNSWHGAEHAFHGTQGQVDDIYRRYCESMLSVDESTQTIIDFLRETQQLNSTLIIYMGDNGHLWGEQGLIDKRTAYEASIRVPLIMHCPELIPPGTVVREMAANIDIAPTILQAAGIAAEKRFHGMSLLQLAQGGDVEGWRTELLYEYFWERWAPSTPTLHALLTPRWKYVRAYGLWDVSELYDLDSDPHELHNLFAEPDHHQRALQMDKRLFELLAETGGDSIPLHRGWSGNAKEERSSKQSAWADFPKSMRNSQD
ncbi:MAG: sulfatase [bacterium]|nr:sulfatase [bacterium]